MSRFPDNTATRAGWDTTEARRHEESCAAPRQKRGLRPHAVNPAAMLASLRCSCAWLLAARRRAVSGLTAFPAHCRGARRLRDAQPKMKEKERHMRTCEIQWFDKAGQLISDDNLSLGRVRVKKYSYEWRKWDNQKKCWLFGTMHFQPSKWFHI